MVYNTNIKTHFSVHVNISLIMDNLEDIDSPVSFALSFNLLYIYFTSRKNS